jgi:hypothetical protein
VTDWRLYTADHRQLDGVHRVGAPGATNYAKIIRETAVAARSRHAFTNRTRSSIAGQVPDGPPHLPCSVQVTEELTPTSGDLIAARP